MTTYNSERFSHIVTRAQIDELNARMQAAADSYYDWGRDDDPLHDLTLEIGHLYGAGEPRADLVASTELLGSDYICALDDGSLVAWGADRPIPGASCSWRELVIVSEPAGTGGGV